MFEVCPLHVPGTEEETINKIDINPATKELIGDMKIKYIIADIIAVELNIAFYPEVMTFSI